MKKTIVFRKYRDINIESFKRDIQEKFDATTTDDRDVDSLVRCYNTSVQEVIDLHAPLQTRTVTIRPKRTYISQEVKQEKVILRRQERKWRKTKSVFDREQYAEQRNYVTELINKTEKDYNSGKILEYKNDPKNMYRFMSGLLGKNGQLPLPPHTCPVELSNDFNHHYRDKTGKVLTSLEEKKSMIGNYSFVNKPFEGQPLEEFKPLTEQQVKKIVSRSANKSCGLDPLPTWLLKMCEDELLPYLGAIINESLTSAVMPNEYKLAHLNPLLKKIGLDIVDKNNFRPVSNLAYVSKLIESGAAVQLKDHVKDHDLFEKFQSAYLEGRGTETALLRMNNDFLCAKDVQHVTALLLLDDSSAFDTVNHSKLLDRLDVSFGVRGSALAWLRSYLTDRRTVVKIAEVTSDEIRITSGVPQGSVLGPILFIVYTSPIGDIIRKYKLSFHIYADDKSLYISFVPSKMKNALESTCNCVRELDAFLTENDMKLNGPKTQWMLLGTRQQLAKLDDPILELNNVSITPVEEARSLGVIFDRELRMDAHVNSLCKAAYFQLHNISAIRDTLTYDAAAAAIHAYVMSRLDTNNALLYGLPKTTMKKLQKVQNAAARCLTFAKRREHMTPVLAELHWLPMTSRIEHKYLTLTHKCVYGTAPEYLSELLTEYKPRESNRSAKDTSLLDVPRSKLMSGGDRAFSSVAPKLWNGLPQDIRCEKKFPTFKKQIKTHLYKLAYD